MTTTKRSLKDVEDTRNAMAASVLFWAVVPGIAGTVFGYLDPARNVALWGIIPAAIGLVTGCYSIMSDDPVAKALRFPGAALALVLDALGGPVR